MRMSKAILNTAAEARYRLLLLLSVLPKADYSHMWLSCLDFITIYGPAFGVSDVNLHGNNRMKFTEYATRGIEVNQGIRTLAMSGWVTVTAGKTCFTYRITESGQAFADDLQSSYAKIYRLQASLAFSKYGKQSAAELDALIRNKALNVQEDLNG